VIGISQLDISGGDELVAGYNPHSAKYIFVFNASGCDGPYDHLLTIFYKGILYGRVGWGGRWSRLDFCRSSVFLWLCCGGWGDGFF
jgi:hypothetical protein